MSRFLWFTDHFTIFLPFNAKRSNVVANPDVTLWYCEFISVRSSQYFHATEIFSVKVIFIQNHI